jgi:hypothetical protein
MGKTQTETCTGTQTNGDKTMKEDNIEELKAFLKAKNCYVATESMGYCKKCGKWKDLRSGLCFDCAVPACIREKCPFERLVYCGQGRKQIWKDMIYTGFEGKRHCDRDQGVCSDREYAIALDKLDCGGVNQA